MHVNAQFNNRLYVLKTGSAVTGWKPVNDLSSYRYNKPSHVCDSWGTTSNRV